VVRSRPSSTRLRWTQLRRGSVGANAPASTASNLGGKSTPVDAPEMEFLQAFESESFDRFVERIKPAP